MKDPIRGSSLRFHFADGPMAGKTFEHTFSQDGAVAFHMMGDGKSAHAPAVTGRPTPGPTLKYEVAAIRDDVYAVSYLSKGYTLTTILDFETKKLVAFSSNERMVSVQHGTFDTAEPRAPEAQRNARDAHPR